MLHTHAHTHTLDSSDHHDIKLIPCLEETPKLTSKTGNVTEMLQGKSLDLSLVSDISENDCTCLKMYFNIINIAYMVYSKRVNYQTN